MRLEARDIRKSFGSTVALCGVPLTLEPGRVHALVGENGAGKSTLLKVCAGIEHADSGEILLDEAAYRPASATEARSKGVALVFQELTVSPTLSVAENIFIDRLSRFSNRSGFVSERKLNAAACDLLDRLHLDIDPRAEARTLDFGQMKCVEICRALSVDPQIVLMDESTAFLNYAETRAVLDAIGRLRNEGMAVAFVSHHLNEVFEVADDLTVLKDGAFAGKFERNEVTPAQLHALMVGRELANDLYPERRLVPDSVEPILTVSDARSRRNSPTYDITLRPGEILGIAGLKGAGGELLIDALAGDHALSSGRIRLNGHEPRLSAPGDAWANGIALLPGDRGGQGLITAFSILENISLPVRPRKGPFFDQRKAERLTREAITRLNIKADGPDAPVESLSGGNMQKVLLGKCLAVSPRILLLNNPTRGVDLGARQEIYRALDRLATEGLAIMILSEDLPELIGLSHRIAIFRNGSLETILDNHTQVTETDLVARMM